VTSVAAIVVLRIASQDSLRPPSLTLELVGLLVGSSFVALKGSEHFGCYSMRSWGDFATWIVGVEVWVVLGRNIVLSHIVCVLLICK
jgi:hypothetical protein